MSQERKAIAWRQRHRMMVERYWELLDDPELTAIERLRTLREEFGPHWAIYFHPEKTDRVKRMLFDAQMRLEARQRAWSNFLAAQEVA